MPPRPNQGTGQRDLLNHQNGKGDADRSPGYRKFYDDILFPPAEGFFRVTPNRIRKHYGVQRKYPTIASGGFDHP